MMSTVWLRPRRQMILWNISKSVIQGGNPHCYRTSKGADAQNLCNLLYKKTKLEDTFGVNMLAVADGRPETLGLVPIIRHHVKFQYELAHKK